MNNAANPTQITFYTFFTLIFQSICGILPGCLILASDGSFTWNLVMPIIIYLFLCEIMQVINRRLYKRGKNLPLPLFVAKLLISCILIYLFAQKTSLWYGVILLAYEGMQLLQFSRNYSYTDSFYFTFMNPFFKGVVFNGLISFKLPFKFQIASFEPFLFSFLVLLMATVFVQGIYSYLGRQSRFSFLFLVAWIGLLVYLVFLSINGSLSIPKFAGLIIVNILMLAPIFSKKRKTVEKEALVNLLSIIDLFIFYI